MRDLNTNHKKPTITIIIIALLLLTGVTAGGLRMLGGDTQTEQKTVATEEQVQTATAVRYVAQPGKIVLDQLKDHAREVIVKDSEYGQYVDSINGLKGGTGNKYWTYYVDGQMANIGAGEYVTEGGEEVVWKFE
jgi:uncharacterized protein DUF4430